MKQPISKLKEFFATFKMPTAPQFGDLIDSFFHKDGKIPASQVEGWTDDSAVVLLPGETELPEQGDKNKSLTVLGGTNGRILTYGDEQFIIQPNHQVILFWIAADQKWVIQDDVALPVPEGTNEVKENGTGLLNQDGGFKIDKNLRFIAKTSANIFNKKSGNIIVATTSVTAGVVASNHNFLIRFNASDGIITGGETYTVKQDLATTGTGRILYYDVNNAMISAVANVAGTNDKIVTFTPPANYAYMYLNVGHLLDANTYELRNNPVINSVMLVKGVIAKDYEEFDAIIGVDENKIQGYPAVKQLVDDKPLVMVPKKNMIDPSLIDHTKRYSPATKTIVSSSGTVYSMTGFIPVDEDGFYCCFLDNDPNASFTGGYFAAEGSTSAIDTVFFDNAVGNKGKVYKVPTGRGIKGVRLNAERTAVGSTVLRGNYQNEPGEKATDWEAYQLVKRINPNYLGNSSGVVPITPSNELEKFTTFDNKAFSGSTEPIKNFKRHWVLKDKNLNVVGTGDSHFARSDEHCIPHPKANERPPMMMAYNLASYLWDKMRWDNQFYRRYDYVKDGVAFFTETGNWSTVSGLSDWDEGTSRNGLTRMSDGGAASFSFVIPKKAWQFNLIYRTDSLATENAPLAIEQGNNHVQVFDEATQTWVEANGYILNQRESPPTILPSVTYIDPQTGNNATLTNYQVKGNSTYQKRLLMRCKGAGFDSRETEKKVTISTASGRLMYWGCEWSLRESMITFINSGRGSHSTVITLASHALSHYQDNEIWSFKPDLLLTEDAVHNAGAGGPLSALNPSTYWWRTSDNFFKADNGISMDARCTALGLPKPEMIIFNSVISVNFNGIDANGELILSTLKDGRVWSSVDAQMSCWEHFNRNYPDVIYINTIRGWVNAAIKCYGDLRTATIGSSRSGNTFTSEGSHPNTTGSKVLAREILPVLDFVHQ